ncbi:MAG: hypothetical protein HW402_986 [Dehalococcoidales bacterium]|nr:hypothetical protein [Dehalococcoidales bacterium]
MQTTPKAYGYAGLIAVLGLVALLVSLVVMLLLPDIRFAAWAILVLGILLLAAAFIINFRQVSHAVAGRRGRFSTGSTVMTSIFIGIILLANALSIGAYKRFDLSMLAQFTLADQTKDILAKLETPVEALGFFGATDPYGTNGYATSLLNEYQNYTDKLTVKTIDPDAHPEEARKYGITGYGAYGKIVFESQNRRRLVSPQDIAEGAEHAFTSAILEVTGTVQKKVYFLIGHDERDINSTAASGYSSVLEGLRTDLYQVETLSLLTSPGIPQDAAVLVIAAPQKALSSREIATIMVYLAGGGQVLILADPDPPPGLDIIIAPWLVSIESGTVIDPTSYVAPKKTLPSVTSERNVFGLPITYFPGAAAIIPQEKIPQGIQILALVKTTKDSWVEKDFDPEKDPTFDAGKDTLGPFPLGVLIAAQSSGGAEGKLTRLAVIGDSDFASNEHFRNGNNSDLFLNSVNWLAEEAELITIRRQVLPFRRLVVDQPTANFINYSSIGVLPLLVLITGAVIWWRRR